eukprot:TCONS_00040657-protein
MEQEDLLIDLDTALSVAHFQNSCRTTRGRTYSCAVDCFLEISYRLLLPEIKAKLAFEELSEFFYLLYISGSMEIPIENDITVDVKSNAFRLLDEIREPIWSKIIENCGTYASRNSDAQFTELFSDNLFKTLSEGEKRLFETRFDVRGTCPVCNNERQSKTGIIVALLTDFLYPEITIDPNIWPDCVNRALEPSAEVYCNICSVNIPAGYQSVDLPCYLLIEFSSTIHNSCTFFDQITVKGDTYRLQAVVRNLGFHFACGVFIENKWIYIDDLNPEKIIFENVNAMFSENDKGWFFAFYKKTDEETDFVVHDAT